MSSTPIPERVTKWGQAVLIWAAIIGGGYTVTSKAVATVKAGPEAKAEAGALNVRVTKLERQSCFILRGIEKVAKIRYNRPEECGE